MAENLTSYKIGLEVEVDSSQLAELQKLLQKVDSLKNDFKGLGDAAEKASKQTGKVLEHKNTFVRIAEVVDNATKSVWKFKDVFDKNGQSIQSTATQIQKASERIKTITQEYDKATKTLSTTTTITNELGDVLSKVTVQKQTLGKVIDRQTEVVRNENGEWEKHILFFHEYGEVVEKVIPLKNYLGRVIDRQIVTFREENGELKRTIYTFYESGKVVENTVKVMESAYQGISLAFGELLKVKQLASQVTDIDSLAGQGAMVKDFTIDVENYETIVRRNIVLRDGLVLQARSRVEIDKTTGAIRLYDTELSKASQNLDKMNRHLLTVGQRLADTATRFLYWQVAGGIILGTQAAFGLLAKSITEVDAAMVGIRKVFTGTEEDLQFLKTEAVAFGTQFAKSATEALEAMRMWAQQGKDMSEILSLTKASLVAANVAEMTAAEATKFMTAASLQFNIAASESMSIIDKWNNVSNRYAVTVRQLAESVAAAGSVAKNAGVNMDYFNGITAAVAAATAKEGSEIGTAFKTIFARLQQGSDESAEALSEAEKALNAVGIAVRSDENTFRAASDVLSDLNKVWAKLTDVQRNNIAFALAGRNHYSTFNSLMNNYALAMRAVVTSTESHGSAMRENQKYMDSLQARFTVLLNKITATGIALGDAGLLGALKGLVSILTKGTEALHTFASGLNGTTLTLWGILGAITTVKAALDAYRISLQNQDALSSFTKKLADLGKALTNIWNLLKTGKILPELGNWLLGLINPFNLAVAGVLALTNAWGKYNKAVKEAEERSHRISDILKNGVTEANVEQAKKDIEALQQALEKVTVSYDNSWARTYRKSIGLGDFESEEEVHKRIKELQDAINYYEYVQKNQIGPLTEQAQSYRELATSLRAAAEEADNLQKLAVAGEASSEQIKRLNELTVSYAKQMPWIVQNGQIRVDLLIREAEEEQKLAEIKFQAAKTAATADIDKTRAQLEATDARIKMLQAEREALLEAAKAETLFGSRSAKGVVDYDKLKEIDAELAKVQEQRLQSLSLLKAQERLILAETYEDYIGSVTGYMPSADGKTSGAADAFDRALQVFKDKLKLREIAGQAAYEYLMTHVKPLAGGDDLETELNDVKIAVQELANDAFEPLADSVDKSIKTLADMSEMLTDINTQAKIGAYVNARMFEAGLLKPAENAAGAIKDFADRYEGELKQLFEAQAKLIDGTLRSDLEKIDKQLADLSQESFVQDSASKAVYTDLLAKRKQIADSLAAETALREQINAEVQATIEKINILGNLERIIGDRQTRIFDGLAERAKEIVQAVNSVAKSLENLSLDETPFYDKFASKYLTSLESSGDEFSDYIARVKKQFDDMNSELSSRVQSQAKLAARKNAASALMEEYSNQLKRLRNSREVVAAMFPGESPANVPQLAALDAEIASVDAEYKKLQDSVIELDKAMESNEKSMNRMQRVYRETAERIRVMQAELQLYNALVKDASDLNAKFAALSGETAKAINQAEHRSRFQSMFALMAPGLENPFGKRSDMAKAIVDAYVSELSQIGDLTAEQESIIARYSAQIANLEQKMQSASKAYRRDYEAQINALKNNKELQAALNAIGMSYDELRTKIQQVVDAQREYIEQVERENYVQKIKDIISGIFDFAGSDFITEKVDVFGNVMRDVEGVAIKIFDAVRATDNLAQSMLQKLSQGISNIVEETLNLSLPNIGELLVERATSIGAISELMADEMEKVLPKWDAIVDEMQASVLGIFDESKWAKALADWSRRMSSGAVDFGNLINQVLMEMPMLMSNLLEQMPTLVAAATKNMIASIMNTVIDALNVLINTINMIIPENNRIDIIHRIEYQALPRITEQTTNNTTETRTYNAGNTQSISYNIQYHVHTQAFMGDEEDARQFMLLLEKYRREEELRTV